MTSDLELLEKAAKAAGYRDFTFINGRGAVYDPQPGIVQPYRPWNPLEDDGDALRLAVDVLNWPHGGRAFDNARDALFVVGKLPKDHHAATRLIIVYAAAQFPPKT